MDALDWDDVRYFLAAAQAGSLSVAARTLEVSVATVGRRVERLEQSLGVLLLHRGPHGVTLSEEGGALHERAEGVAQAVHDLCRASHTQRHGEAITGAVTISMIDSMVHILLDERLGEFLDGHPGLELTMRGEPHKAQLATLEADIVVRASRPQELDAVAKRVLQLDYGVYAHPTYLDRCAALSSAEPVYNMISYVPKFASTPEMVWLREHYATHRWSLRLKTMSEIALAIRTGVGVGLIPHMLATEELVCLERATGFASREIWVATHRDLQRVRRVRVVMDYLIEALSGLA